MTHHRNLSLAAMVAASFMLAAPAPYLRAQSPNGTDAAVDREVRGLKAAYLRCERAATERLLGTDDAATCSVIYEELLKIGFDSDFKRLLAWWHAERVAEARGERIAIP